jgi:hypothetical protein
MVDELRSASWSNLFDAISSLRSEWLRTRGQVSVYGETDVVVYLDGSRLGGPGALRTISTISVQWARFLTPSEAQSQFGINHPQGAIVVSTRP